MIKLSDRLQTIADRIEQSETMADIGTDHGFLPIYLWQTGKCPQVILTDVSEASLAKAEENYRKFAERIADDKIDGSSISGSSADDLKDGFQFRAGDGLTILKPYEVDTVVIAGMGGKLIKDILAANIELTRSFKKFILQPRTGQAELRKWLCDNDFAIISEDVAEEGNYIPEIITAVSPALDRSKRLSMAEEFADLLAGCNLGDIIYKIPPWIVDAGGPVEEFLTRNIEKEKNILNNVMLAKERNLEQEQQICDDIYYLKGLLKEYKNGNQC